MAKSIQRNGRTAALQQMTLNGAFLLLQFGFVAESVLVLMTGLFLVAVLSL